MNEKRLLQGAVAVAILLPMLLIVAMWKTHARVGKEATEAAAAAERSDNDDGYRAYQEAGKNRLMPVGMGLAWETGWHRAEKEEQEKRRAWLETRERRERDRRQAAEDRDKLEMQRSQWEHAELWLHAQGFYEHGGDYYKVIRAMLELIRLRDQCHTSEERDSVTNLINTVNTGLERMKYQDLERYFRDSGTPMSEAEWLELYRLHLQHGW